MSENYLIHFGNKNSGRYPRGSGENPHQHDGYGKVGRKLSEKEVNDISNTFEKDVHNKEVDLTEKLRQQYLDELYKDEGPDGYNWRKYDNSKNEEEQMDFFYGHKHIYNKAAHDASEKIVNQYISKYGNDNLNSILEKSEMKIDKNQYNQPYFTYKPKATTIHSAQLTKKQKIGYGVATAALLAAGGIALAKLGV